MRHYGIGPLTSVGGAALGGELSASEPGIPSGSPQREIGRLLRIVRTRIARKRVAPD